MAAAAGSASSSSETTAEGPVLSLINKRLRALRKKLNRIAQMEESLSQGKILNKEQEETLRSKPSVLASIDELEKLRQPLSCAVDQEVELALERKNRKPEIQTAENPNAEETAEASESKMGDDNGVSAVADLLNLIYFGSVFDVQTLSKAHENMLTRTHERNCCLTYDYVTDDDAAGDPLKEFDLDLISMLGGLLICRPVNSSLSHQNALQKCVEHAKLWLTNSEQPINPDSNINYAGLREKLNKIMASEYFTTAPEIKAPVEVAAAAGNYSSFQVPVHGSIISPVDVTVQVENPVAEHQQEEEQSPNSHDNGMYDYETGQAEELNQGGSEAENASEALAQSEQGVPDVKLDQHSRERDLRELQGTRRSYQNYRGGRGGGGRRGYSNGRGGRGTYRGGYQNGRSEFYDHSGGGSHYTRINFNYRGRGGRGMSGNHNSYHAPAGHTGHAQEAS